MTQMLERFGGNTPNTHDAETIDTIQQDLLRDSRVIQMGVFRGMRGAIQKRRAMRAMRDEAEWLVRESEAPRLQTLHTVAEAAANTHDEELTDLATEQLETLYPEEEDPIKDNFNKAQRSAYLAAIALTDPEHPFSTSLIEARAAAEAKSGLYFDDVITHTEQIGKLVREQDEHERARQQRLEEAEAKAKVNGEDLDKQPDDAVKIDMSSLFDDDEDDVKKVA